MKKEDFFMKRATGFTAVLMAAAMVFTMAGCGSSKDADTSAKKETKTEDSKDKENSDKQFIVGFDAEYPPYGYKDDNGEYVGFDLDLAQEVCARNGWELVKQPIDWDSKDMELNSGSIDCIWNGFTMTGREDDYTWSKPYVDNSIVVVVKEGSGIEKKEDLAGKVVAVQADSSGLAALTDEEDNEENLKLAASFSDLQQVADYNTAFMNLEAGAVDAIVVDIGVADYQLESRTGFVMLDDKIRTEQYAVGFKLGNEELRDQVQSTLDEMVKTVHLMISQKNGIYQIWYVLVSKEQRNGI